ncbi:hypothetical protein P0F65_12995 [Sphingomonas sp. I4]
MVMGPPGSGKSTLARMLGERLGLPVHHADALFHDPGWVARPREDFIADMVAIAAQPAWVIDGNYSGAHYGPAIADRLARAERIILLDLPRRVTIPVSCGVWHAIMGSSVPTARRDARSGWTGHFWAIAGNGGGRCGRGSCGCWRGWRIG